METGFSIEILGGNAPKSVRCKGTQQPLSKLISESELVYDIGKIHSGESVSHTFVVRNISNEVLYVKSYKVNCNCTSLNCSPEIIRPGEKLEIVMTYITNDNVNSFSSMATVIISQAKEPIVLCLKGELLHNFNKHCKNQKWYKKIPLFR